MYKVLLADDESIVIESLKFIIEKKFGPSVETESAKTGRSVIELAESFKPDVAFMDIQMPGINGIEAMREIRKENPNIIFIVMTAYDKFDYAKQAIDLGVLEYLSKPVGREKIENVLTRAFEIIDENREKRSKELMIKEKLETVVPVIESGLVYTMLLGEGNATAINHYKELLSITDDYGFVCVLEAWEKENENLTNEIGSGVRLENNYSYIREQLKENINCIIGPVMSNRIVLLVPFHKSEQEYGERVIFIERVRDLICGLGREIDTTLRLGIGNVKNFERITESYREATLALSVGIGSVSHAKDTEVGVSWEDDYPVDTEKALLSSVEHGDAKEAVMYAERFFDWMAEEYKDHMDDIRIKVLDHVLWSERIGYEHANKKYTFLSRTDYLPYVNGCGNLNDLKSWFEGKISDAAAMVSNMKEESRKSPVKKACDYINENYMRDISLDDVAQKVDISSYYLSKLFKEEEGVNFIDYITDLRIKEACRLMDQSTLSIRDIGAKVGYLDPNYFSRAFKKNTGKSPSEYREGQA